jgi:RNase P/RNase MRP subunit p30
MHFFDVVALKGETGLEPLARRFGFRKMFLVGKDVELVGDTKHLSEEGRYIVKSGNNEVLSKAVRSNAVVGVILEDGKASGKFIEELHTHEKLLFIPVAPLICPNQESRLRNLHRAKGMLRAALMGKARVSIITLAEEKECLLSGMQLFEVAKLLGADDRTAGEMLASAGDSL